MINLNQKYERADFVDFLQNTLLNDYSRDVRPVSTQGLGTIIKAISLGRSETLDLHVFEFEYTGSSNKRVTLTKEAFQIMKQSATFNAIAVFYGQDSEDWRLSFLTANPQKTEKGRVTLAYSNPRRYSFFLGSNAKVNTPTKFLINRGKIVSFDDLRSRFSIEVVNKEFYKEISQAFTKLSNGLLKLPSVQEKSQASLEFSVRLIGRIIFCWFLREKKSHAGKALMPNDLLSLDAVNQNEEYYHKILEPIFFEVLNKPIKQRKDEFIKEPFLSVPYLNGGLFSPQDDDFYKRTNGDFQSQFHNTLVVPNKWFKEFFETLETYNFTIDENTSFDEELSIDPEMLGRIFENLLAEINPETGESARKATGSYYTPRTIVSYMVDESLLLYLKEQTNIDIEKLKTIVSYYLSDNEANNFNQDEKEKIIDSLEKLKLLDPACGSGAFPIGALQKIVFILQQIDPNGQLWFKRQLDKTSPELRRVIEREFEHQNFDYIRKLGIIRENIYGIDIQPIATEISRLRCFLTLIVDERIQDESENRGIEPLPNLDFKFVTANSLIGLPTNSNPGQIAMFDNQEKIDELKLVRDQYFTSSGIEREQLKAEFSKLQKEMIFQLIQEHGLMSLFKAELTKKLTEWDPFSHNASTWFDPEWMFGIKGGFDIVIANPPYFRSRDLARDLVTIYSSQYKLIQSGFDLATLFIELADKLINQTGIISFIITNKIFSARYAIKLREYLIKNHRLNQVINLYSHLFESTPVETTIIIITYNNERLKYNNYLKKDQVLKIEPVFTIDPKNYLKLPNKIFIFPVSKIDQILLNKLTSFTNKISDFYSISAGYGITGIQNLLNKSKSKTSQIPVFSGKCIWTYYNLEPEYYIDQKEHFNTISNSSVLIRELSTKNRATIITNLSSGLALNSITIVESKSKTASKEIFLSIFNSQLFYKIYCLFYESTRTHSNLRFKSIYLNEIPFPDLTHYDNSELTDLTNKILEFTKNNNQENKNNIDEQISNLKKRVDKIIYLLFGLSEDEVTTMEGDGNV